ncbi:MAG: hypothetical protein ACRCU3_01875 [Eubacteriaceae bacterium]
MKEFLNNQITRYDGKNVFIEFTRSAFSINKVEICFFYYDLSKLKKERITKSIKIYIDFEKFLSLGIDISSGRLLRKLRNLTETNPNEPAFITRGGTSSSKLISQNRERSDKKCESRIFSIKKAKATGKDFLLEAISGPGEETSTGLIKPIFKVPDQQIVIAISQEQLQGMIELVKLELQAYINYTMAVYQKELKVK